MSEEHAEEHHTNYVKIWAILVVLLGVSIAGPFFGHPVVTLVTAFGIAVVKAYMVAKNFMHVNVQPRYVAYLLGTALAFMLLFFATGVGNASTFQMIPVIMGREMPRLMPELSSAERQREVDKEAAAIIGFTSAIAAYGAFFIPKSYGTSIARALLRR